jgi:hypothetical protein
MMGTALIHVRMLDGAMLMCLKSSSSGCGLTTICLALGLISFATKRSHMSQIMMRGRILAQGFTIFGLVGGMVYSVRKK